MKDIHEMAIDVVNPDGGELNETQENEVYALVDFATKVLQNYIRPTKDALDLPAGGRVMYFCQPCHCYHVAVCPNTANQ